MVNGFNASLSDFNNDAFTDIVWRNQATGQNELWRMNGDRLQATALLPPQIDLGWQVEGTGDFDGDGRTDLIWRHSSTGQNALWMMNGTTLLRELYTVSIGDANWQIDGVGDLNRDGKSDLIWHHHHTGQTVAWYMDGATPLSAAPLPVMNNPALSLGGVADFNGDGYDDLVWHDQNSRQLHLWYLNGTTRIGSETLNVTAPNATTPNAITPANSDLQGVGDFNGDGQADLLWRGDRNSATPGQLQIWFMEGTRLNDAKPVTLVPIFPSRVAQASDFHWQATTTGSGDRPQSLRLTNASRTLTRNTAQTITWNPGRLGGTVDLALYQNDRFHSYIARQTPDDGTLTWTPPAQVAAGQNYRLRLSSNSDYTRYDFSDSPFTIQNPRLTLTSPTRIQTLEVGDSYDITWESNFRSTNSPVRLELYKAGQFQRLIQAATPNDGLHRWQVPNDVPFDTDYQIRISQVNSASPVLGAQDFSPGRFRIFPQPGIDIQLFDPQGSFSSFQSQALSIAAENWEYLLSRDKDRSGILRVVVTQSSTRMDGRGWGNFFSTGLAEAFVDPQPNRRTNFSEAVDLNGVDYDNRVNWNPETTATMTSRRLITTMMHELGHVLGLGHEFEDRNSLMFASEGPGIPTITAQSLSTLEQLGYGVNRSLADKLRWSVPFLNMFV